MASSSPQLTSTIPRCAVCGEPLGVYEPAVEIDGERVRRASRAAVPDLCSAGGASCYHAGCFEPDVAASDA